MKRERETTTTKSQFDVGKTTCSGEEKSNVTHPLSLEKTEKIVILRIN